MMPLQSALTSLIVLLALIAATRRPGMPRSGPMAVILIMAPVWITLTMIMALFFGLADHPVLGPYVGTLAGPIIVGAVLAVLWQLWAMRSPGARWFRRLPELAAAGIVGGLAGLLWQGCDYLV